MNKKLPSVIVLCVIGLLAGLLLSLTNQMTKDQIEIQEALSAEAARSSVLEAAESFEALEVQESRYNLDNLYQGIAEDGLTDDTPLFRNLASLDIEELIMAFEDEFGCRIPDGDAAGFHTVGDVIRYLEEKGKRAEGE